MTILLTVFHILICVFLVLVVLTQQGKGQDLASAFGGAGTQAAFGARGTATLLTKITAGAAATFMVTSLLLGYLEADPETDTVVDVPEMTIPAPPAEGGTEAGDPETGTPEPEPPGEEPEPESGETPEDARGAGPGPSSGRDPS